MSPELSQAERDEARRDRRIWTTLVILGVLAAIAAIYFGWGIIAGRLEAAKKLDRAIAISKQADATVIATDELIRATITTDTAARVSALEPQIGISKAQLLEAASLVDQGYEKLTDDEQKQARLVQASARKRAAMLDAAPPILSAIQSAAVARGFAEQGWGRLLAADQLARQSVADYNTRTKSAVATASALNDNAAAGFSASRDLLSQAASAFPDAKLGVFVTYVDKRLALVALSKQADELWLAGKVAQANKLIASYNAGDAKAVAIAKTLPASPGLAIADAYKALTEAPMKTYLEARQKAAEADAALKAL